MKTSASSEKLHGYAIERARVLVACSALILLAHVLDVVRAQGPNWAALGVRLAWTALLLANAGFLAWARRAVYLRTSAAADLGTAVLFLTLLAVTGGSRSPFLSFAYVLVIVLPVFSAEILAAALASSALLVLGASAFLLRDGADLGDQIAAAVTGLMAFTVAWLLAAATLRSRRRAEALDLAHDGALLRLAESERLAAVGRLASEVAHHVNNPLAAARATATFLRGGGGGEEARAAWEDLLGALDRIAELTRRLQRDGAAPTSDVR